MEIEVFPAVYDGMLLARVFFMCSADAYGADNKD
jgi:hypothetical protein